MPSWLSSLQASLFLSTPSARRATVQKFFCSVFAPISIHALREEGDVVVSHTTHTDDISIHALREEGDAKTGYRSTTVLHFYPRPPRGGRRLILLVFRAVTLFLSTPSARRATETGAMSVTPINISIHALREEGDGCPVNILASHQYFYPRPPRGGRRAQSCKAFITTSNFYPRPPRGGRLTYALIGNALTLFLSTPSARRATL